MRKKNILTIATAVLLAGTVATGVAMAAKQGDGEVDAATLAHAKVSLGQAIATAEQQTGGRALSASVSAEGNALKIEVETTGPHGMKTVVVDAQSGAVTTTYAGEQAGGQEEQD